MQWFPARNRLVPATHQPGTYSSPAYFRARRRARRRPRPGFDLESRESIAARLLRHSFSTARLGRAPPPRPATPSPNRTIALAAPNPAPFFSSSSLFSCHSRPSMPYMQREIYVGQPVRSYGTMSCRTLRTRSQSIAAPLWKELRDCGHRICFVNAAWSLLNHDSVVASDVKRAWPVAGA